MKRNLLFILTKSLKHMSTAKLKTILSTFSSWCYNHDLKRNSWFWDDNGNSAQRSRRERQLSFTDQVKIGKYTICYWSDCSMSRKHVYWSDGLYLQDVDDVNVTFGDINRISCVIHDIIDNRNLPSQDI